MLHDQKVFPDPMSFRPERFLDQNGRLRKLEPHEDPSTIAFGFGRRICPGMFLADNSIFINIAAMLYVFNISPERASNGDDIIPHVEFHGFIRFVVFNTDRFTFFTSRFIVIPHRSSAVSHLGPQWQPISLEPPLVLSGEVGQGIR